MNNAMNGIRIANEFKKLILLGRKSSDKKDYPEIEQYLNQNHETSRLEEALCHSEYPSVDPCWKEKKIEQLYRDVQMMNLRKIRTRRIVIFTSVAALLFISLIIYLMPNHENYTISHDSYSVKQNKPILILSNGTSVDLTSVIDSIQTGNTILQKKGATALQYPAGSSSTTSQAYNRLSIPAHLTYCVVLSDGTEVLLNACSELRYPEQFNGETRTVELQGEAFFKVAKSSKPFIVNTNTMSLKVYGTQFNVATYASMTETILLSGSVGITEIGKEEEIRLIPNQKHIIRDGKVTVENVDAQNAVGWLKNEFDYAQIPLSDLLMKISDWYGVEFDIKTKGIDSQRMNVNSPRSTDILKLLEVIEYSTNLSFIRETNQKFIVKQK